MTYCLGILVRTGLVMMTDSRTNAGVDDISIFRKLHCYEEDDERFIAVATSGNLSVTQTALWYAGEEGEADTIAAQPSIFRVARCIGRALNRAREEVREALDRDHIRSDATMLVGGRVGGEPVKLFEVYSTGNVLECRPEDPFLQIGQFTYGRPILDRALDYDTSLIQAVKIGLISFDNTMRSNLAVGLPVDIVTLANRPGSSPLHHRIEDDDPYFDALSRAWSEGVSRAVASIERPPFIPEDGGETSARAD